MRAAKSKAPRDLYTYCVIPPRRCFIIRLAFSFFFPPATARSIRFSYPRTLFNRVKRATSRCCCSVKSITTAFRQSASYVRRLFFCERGFGLLQSKENSVIYIPRKVFSQNSPCSVKQRKTVISWDWKKRELTSQIDIENARGKKKTRKSFRPPHAKLHRLRVLGSPYSSLAIERSPG